MTNDEAIAIIRNEYKCVGRDCDIERSCGKCDLMIPSKEPILEAYKLAIKALEQQPCEDWYDVPSDEMTLEQARQAVKDLRKKLTEYLEQEPCDDAISREDAFEIIASNDATDGREPIFTGRQVVALLSTLPSVTQKPIGCDDAISREELLKAIDTWDKFGYTETGCFVREPKGDYVPYIHYDDVIKCIKALPPVTPQQKTGRWILSGGYWRCSECKEKALLKLDKSKGGCREYEPVRSKHCPSCGIKMQESDG